MKLRFQLVAVFDGGWAEFLLARLMFLLPDCVAGFPFCAFGVTVFFVVAGFFFTPVVVCDNSGADAASSTANSRIVSLFINDSPLRSVSLFLKRDFSGREFTWAGLSLD